MCSIISSTSLAQHSVTSNAPAILGDAPPFASGASSTSLSSFVSDDETNVNGPPSLKRKRQSRWDRKEIMTHGKDYHHDLGEGGSIQRRIQKLRAMNANTQRPFRCPVCLDTLGDVVVECAECAHVFCDPCLRECLKRKDSCCPMCRQNPAPLRRNKPIERLVAALPESCIFLENGCWASLTRATAREHALTCDYARFTCQHCSHVFLRFLHDENECAARLRKCPFAHLGCTFHACHAEIENHLRENHTKHFHLACQRILYSKEFSGASFQALKALHTIAMSWVEDQEVMTRENEHDENQVTRMTLSSIGTNVNTRPPAAAAAASEFLQVVTLAGLDFSQYA